MIYFLVSLCSLSSIGNAVDQPNILFLVTDDQWNREFNFHPEGQSSDGGPLNLTPVIDKLSSEGIIFDRMYATSAVCTPSRYSVLTGEYPSRSNGHQFLINTERYGDQTNPGFQSHIEPGKMHIGKFLKQHGYFTGMVGKNHVLDDHAVQIPNLDPWRKADAYWTNTSEFLASHQEASVKVIQNNDFNFVKNIYRGNIPWQMPESMYAHNQDWITEAGLDFLTLAADQSKPFYLHFCTTINHGPGPNGHKYDGNPRFTPGGLLPEDEIPDCQPTRDTIPTRLQAAGFEPIGQHTDNLWIDDGFNVILDKIESMGEINNTVIFFFVDNGMPAKGALYEGGTHVVSFAWGAPLQGARGRRTDNILMNIDFAPTIYELAGIDEVDWPVMDGKSFAGLLHGDNTPINEIVYLEIGSSRAVIKNNMKLLVWRIHPIREATRDPPAEGEDRISLMHLSTHRGGIDLERLLPGRYPHYFDTDQLYNITSDPNEQINLFNDPSYSEIITDLQRLLAEQVKREPGVFGVYGPLDIPTETSETSETPANPWPQSIQDNDPALNHKCNADTDGSSSYTFGETITSCQERAIRENAVFFTYQHENGRCLPTLTCIFKVAWAEPWKIYHRPTGEWPQVVIENDPALTHRCEPDEGATYSFGETITSCQARASEENKLFVTYQHNNGRCLPTTICIVKIAWSEPWKIYQRPVASSITIAARSIPQIEYKNINGNVSNLTSPTSPTSPTSTPFIDFSGESTKTYSFIPVLANFFMVFTLHML